VAELAPTYLDTTPMCGPPDNVDYEAEANAKGERP
jgi:hypothetical protein